MSGTVAGVVLSGVAIGARRHAGEQRAGTGESAGAERRLVATGDLGVGTVVAEPGTLLPVGSVVPLGTLVPVVSSEATSLALDHRAQLDDAGHLERFERLRLIGHAGQVDDDVLALDADVGLGDAEALELVAHQVADDDQLVLAGRLVGGVDHRQPALEVEPQHRRAFGDERECEERGDDRR